jgi:hypothetical protein
LQIGADQAAVQRVVPAGAARAHGFLDDDLFVAEILVAQPAIAFVGPDHQEPLVARAFEGVAIDDPRLAPRLHMRRDLAVEEAAIGFAEHDLVVGELAHLCLSGDQRGAMRMAPSSRTSSPLK